MGDFFINIEKNGISKDSLFEINETLKKNPLKKIILVVDLRIKPTKKHINNMEVLKYIPNVKHLSILINSSSRLDNIDEVSYLNDLHYFSLDGFYKPSISLAPLLKFKELKELLLESSGLADKHYEIINSFSLLEKLYVYDIDFKKIYHKEKLFDLWVNKSITNEHLIDKKFPLLKTIGLVSCRKICNFDFLNSLVNLENISLNYIRNLIQFPFLPDLKKLKSIELLSDVNLNNIDNILIFNELNSLSITDIKYISFEKFEQFKRLKYLKRFYAQFVNKSDSEKFEHLAMSMQWINAHSSIMK